MPIAIDFSRREFKLGLFAVLAAVMLVAALVERGYRSERTQPPLSQSLQTAAPEVDTRLGSSSLSAHAETEPDSVLAPTSPASARELLARYGLGSDEFETFRDGQPVGEHEEAVLAKLLMRFSRLGPDNVYRWRKTDANWNSIADDVAPHRAKLFAVRGRATMVTEQKLPAELADRFEFERYYRVTLDIDDSPHEALVYTRSVPRAWQRDRSLDEPAAADGLLLKLGATTARATQVVFAADRVAWLPDRAQGAIDIGPDQLALARAGFDVGLFDAVRETNGRGLADADQEAFYQLLAAVGRVAADDWRSADRKLDLVGLLEQPHEHHGELFRVQGTARRVVKVSASDAGMRERLGLDHYYEIDLFVPLGKERIRFGEPKPGEEVPVFESTFPVTLLARQLPAGLAEGDKIHQPIQATAVFFKTWSYPSRYMAKFNRVQPAPLLMTFEPQPVPAGVSKNWVPGALASMSLVVAAIVGVVALWWSRKRNRRAFGRPHDPGRSFP